MTDVVCTHFHSDHVGWLFDADSVPVFPAATIWYGAADWDHFVTGPGEMHDHIRAGLTTHSSRLRPLDRDTAVGPGFDVILTPGHLSVVLSSGRDRALLLGDAITCPVQLDEPGWHSIGDVDPALAELTRERLWDQLAVERTVGTGAHFPELRFGRVLVDGDLVGGHPVGGIGAGTSRRWSG